jgi:phosphatidylserine/phosphatidylglycerophosphate/cardiolipin synthase-like enzyme
MLFEEVAEVPYEPRAFGWRDARPRAGFERLARRLHSKINVGFVAGRDVGDDLLRRRVFDLEGLAALGLDPFAVDQHVMLLGQKRLRVFAKLRFGNGDVHDVLP